MVALCVPAKRLKYPFDYFFTYLKKSKSLNRIRQRVLMKKVSHVFFQRVFFLMDTGHFNFRPYEKKSAHAKKKRGTRIFLYNNTTNHSRCLFIIRFEKLYNDPVHFRPRECS